ncbi:PQQ-binding-like beta-propeller repeat protein [Haladaptatus sp. DFWS20]|uniref:outer membrane protein assembly factor BamB family protein n=1 Tax=Haladaptatus sp. DFWS20 TaxID=3403467 RepID=UPI003EB79200
MPSDNRRTFLKTIGVTAGAMSLTGTGVVLAQQDDNDSDDDEGEQKSTGWTTYRGNVGRTGATAVSGPTPRATTDWSIDLDGKVEYVEPVVVDGTVFLAVRTSGYEESEGYVVAYDANTGEQKWRRDDLSRPDNPTVVDSTVYVGTDGYNDKGENASYALDAETGETKWKLAKPQYGTPVVVDRRVYTGAESAHDAETGDVIWDKPGLSTDVFYGNETLYYDSGTARNPEDGSAYWTDTLHNKEEFAVEGGLVYATYWDSEDNSDILARSGDDRSQVWTHETKRGGSTFDSITVGDGSVYYTEYEEGYILRALDSKTGEVQWEHELDVNITSPPTLADGIVYLGGQVPSEDDMGEALVIAVDANTAEHKWTYTFGGDDFDGYGSAAGAPVVVDGRVYVATHPTDGDWEQKDPFDGTLHVLEYSDEEDGSDGQAPEACIEATPNLDDLDAGDTVTLETCSTCYTDEGPKHEWDTDGDGEYNETGHSVTVTVPDCESLEVTLRITDSGGDTDTETVVISRN